MELRPGYKLTEAGVIPRDWEDVSLDDCMNLLTDFEANGSFEHVAQNVRVFDSEQFAWYVRATDLENESPLSNVRYVDSASYRFLKKTPLFGNEVLITKRGEIGKVYLFEKRSDYATLAPNLYLLKLNDSVLPAYVYAYFRYGNGNRTLKNINASTTLGALYKNDVKAIKLPRPPICEQRAIATALSDVHALLGGLDRLIAKKRDLKRAAMQQLLTGQTRLPGFHGDWEVKRLGDLAEIVSGGTPTTGEPTYWNGGIKWCTPTDITGCPGKYLHETERTISRLGLDSSGARLLPAGTLLLCSRATIGELKIASGEICTNQGFKSLLCRPEVSNEFLYYKLLTMKQRMIERAFGSTFLEISKANVAALEIAMPSLSEQTAIAAVVSDMDGELSALDARRNKRGALKQGMMQELLTGRTRLVSPERAYA